VAAAEDARHQTIQIAAEELEADVADVEIVDGRVQVRGVPDKAIELTAIAKMTMQFAGKYPPVVGSGRQAETAASPAFCAQLAEVEVDEETGEALVHRLVVVQDVGRAINPMAIKGQMMGGAVQGLGWALYERMVHDGSGQLLTGSMVDYTVPHFHQAALDIETVIVEVPADHGPFGARGVGEPPVIATAAAVANAITDCAGVRLTDLPMTPSRVLAALSA
jgi:CO/xanthine dehydrogenase Mo-binding subunit